MTLPSPSHLRALPVAFSVLDLWDPSSPLLVSFLCLKYGSLVHRKYHSVIPLVFKINFLLKYGFFELSDFRVKYCILHTYLHPDFNHYYFLVVRAEGEFRVCVFLADSLSHTALRITEKG